MKLHSRKSILSRRNEVKKSEMKIILLLFICFAGCQLSPNTFNPLSRMTDLPPSAGIWNLFYYADTPDCSEENLGLGLFVAQGKVCQITSEETSRMVNCDVPKEEIDFADYSTKNCSGRSYNSTITNYKKCSKRGDIPNAYDLFACGYTIPSEKRVWIEVFDGDSGCDKSPSDRVVEYFIVTDKCYRFDGQGSFKASCKDGIAVISTWDDHDWDCSGEGQLWAKLSPGECTKTGPGQPAGMYVKMLDACTN